MVVVGTVTSKATPVILNVSFKNGLYFVKSVQKMITIDIGVKTVRQSV